MIFITKENNKEKEVELVKCSECNCLIEINDAQCINHSMGLDKYYCKKHQKPYKRVSTCFYNCVFNLKYYAEIEVDENGIPVGYIKIGEQKTSETTA